MIHVHIHIKVRAESIDAFVAATRENGRHSLREPGIARFELVQSASDATRFVLLEQYRSEQARTAHKETDHFQAWFDAVAPMMTEPRRAEIFEQRFPD